MHLPNNIAVLSLAFALVTDGARIQRKRRNVATTVECEYERIAVMLESGGEAEVGECIDAAGNVYNVNPDEVNWAEHHDLLSLQLQPQATVSVLSQQEYKVLSAELVRHEEEVAVVASSGYSILAVESKWSDGRSSTMSQLKPKLTEAKALIKRSSYGTFNIGAKTQYTTANVRSKYSAHNGTCNHGDIRKEIMAQTSGVGNYMYRMFFIPKIEGCGWAGLAAVGCGKPGSSPRNGACWSMYKGGGNFGHSTICQAHELGHNLGLLHAAGADRNGKFITYGDETAIMGNKWKAGMEYSAAHRFQLGWLRQKAGEVVTLSRGVRQLSKLEAGKGSAQAVALRIACSKCVPKEEAKRKNKGGELFVSYAYGQVRVHLRRANAKGVVNQGTELWQSLGSGGSFKNSHGASVYVCSAGTRAKVAVGTSVNDARAQCR